MFQGPCNGDSGGPLYINGQTADNGDVVGRTIAGVVSGGIGCGSKSFENYPQWFARVSLFTNSLLWKSSKLVNILKLS